jgi:hypothetical protein
VKTRNIVAACLLLAGVAWSECIEVHAAGPRESSESPRIVVIVDGKPQSSVLVSFYDSTGKKQVIVSTDVAGEVSTTLAPGDYRVVAAMSEDTSASIWLRVIREHETTPITVDLTTPREEARQALTNYGNLPTKFHLQMFSGSVADPSGAAIPGAVVKVLNKRSAGNGFARRVKADEAGSFSTELDEGFYIALVSAPGFRTEAIPFEITKHGSGVVRVSLQVGSC